MAEGVKGFQKGNEGRPVGSKSTRTIEWENFGKELLEKGMPRALKIMDTCEDDKFMNHFTGLLEYFKPKLARTELKHEGEQTLTVKFIEDGTEDSKS